MTRKDAGFPLPSETFSIATIKLYALKNCSELIVLQISSMALDSPLTQVQRRKLSCSRLARISNST